MSMLRVACQSCWSLQRNIIHKNTGYIYRSHVHHNNYRIPSLKRCLASSTCSFSSSSRQPSNDKNTLASAHVNEATVEEGSISDVADSEVIAMETIAFDELGGTNVWDTLEADISDLTTFNLLKEQYNSRIREISASSTESSVAFEQASEFVVDKDSSTTANEEIVVGPVKNFYKRKHRNKPTHVKKMGDQLTYQSEQNVLAEIDIYTFLGMPQNSINLFNYHRRHGHKFSLEAYNKMIHIWASKGSWRSVQMLVKNLGKEGLQPDHQTYAGLLQTCGQMKDRRKTERILVEMDLKGFKLKDIFQKSVLTSNQIDSIVRAVGPIHPNVIEEYEANRQTPQHKPDSTIGLLQNRNVSEMIEEQKNKELKGYLKVKSIDTSKLNDQKTKKRAAQYQQITERWREDFIKEIRKARETRETKAFLYQRCITYSCILTPEELADVIIEEIVPVICAQPQGVPVNFICRKLGLLIYNRFASKFKGESGVAEKVERIMSEYTASEEWIDSSLIPRQKWKELSDALPYLASEEALPNLWPTKLRAMASSVLFDILKKVAEIDTKMFLKSNLTKIEQALSHHYELTGTNRVGILKFHPVVGHLYKSYLSQMGDLSFETNKLPMLIPPRPWTSSTSGAYMLLHSDLVRTVTGQYKLNKLQSASDGDQLNNIFDSLNYLGNTAWKINQPILDMMIKLYNTSGDMKLDIVGPNLPNIERVNAKRKMTWEERKSRQRKKKLYHELFALRMDLLYKLSVANHFRNDTFWIPSNLDFRGRVYPIAPHCSHIGSDVSRCLLMFAEGKRLGPNGLNWLKVHLVNIHGQLKKSSLEERINYADQHLDQIFDSADQPFDGDKWWQDGTDPWQTLVACIELTNAIRSGDPENFISHIPIQQDGSCNGLQHYATLGRDAYGAKQVNLIPDDRPQDVYSEVASLVEKTRVNDALSGVTIAQQLDGKINRKVVKQTVMTVVYGVTFVGGRLQVEKQLRDVGVDQEILFKASVYIVQGVFKSLTEIFTTARQIQDWLTLAAAQIALTGNCVDWVTPMGLPIVQPYHRETTESISTPLQTMTATQTFDYTQIPHLTKQKGGFPPNFVHSLDSTHMMMTSLRCQANQMTYSSVHDSFWTHAIDVEKMNQYCREEFVALHSLPILEELKKHFEDKYAGLPLRKPLKDGRTVAKFDDLPGKGSFDPKQVINSIYFFS